MKWSLCHPASFARSIRRQGAYGGRTLWMMETSLGHPYTCIPGITTPPPPYTFPPQAPLLQEAGIQQSFLFGEKYITIGLPGSPAFAQHTHKLYTHLHSSILCLLKEINNCVFCSACVDLHTHILTHYSCLCVFPLFPPIKPTSRVVIISEYDRREARLSAMLWPRWHPLIQKRCSRGWRKEELLNC